MTNTPLEEQFTDWLHDDVTKWFFDALKEERERLRRELFESQTDVSLDLARGRDEGLAYAILLVSKVLRAKKERHNATRS